MDELKQSVQLAVHEQKDPLLIYKFEAFELFKQMLDTINKDVISFLFRGELPKQDEEQIRDAQEVRKPKENLQVQKEEVLNINERAAQARQAGQNHQHQQQQITKKIVRNNTKIVKHKQEI